MTAFELVTVRVRDDDGADGVGYTFTKGRNGGAIASIAAPEMPGSSRARTPTFPRASGTRCFGRRTTADAAGKDVRTLREFQAMISAGGVSFPEPDVTDCGAVAAFMKVARPAEAFDLPVTSHGAHDLRVHLLAACPNRTSLEAHGFGLDRFIAEPLAIDHGHAVAPERPGHGITFDWKALARHPG